MTSVLSALAVGSRLLSYAIGGGVVLLAIAVASTPLKPSALVDTVLAMFGPAFIALFATLVSVSLIATARQSAYPQDPLRRRVWVELGMHASSGVATLALTFTLLGISLGIGTLADRDLNPETVSTVVSELTGHFSLAFMTTVVGLPAASVLRAIIQVKERRIQAQAATSRLAIPHAGDPS